MHILRGLYRWCVGQRPASSPPAIHAACTPTPYIPPPPQHYCTVAPYHHREYTPPNAQWRSVIRCDHDHQRQLFIGFGTTAADAVSNVRQYMEQEHQRRHLPIPTHIVYPT